MLQPQVLQSQITSPEPSNNDDSRLESMRQAIRAPVEKYDSLPRAYDTRAYDSVESKSISDYQHQSAASAKPPLREDTIENLRAQMDLVPDSKH